MFANLIYAIGIMGGLAGIAVGINALRVGRSTRSWLPTPGKILTSRIARDSEGDLKPSITYRYFFGGAEFESNRIRTVESYSSFRGSSAQQVVDRYRPTQQVIVFVNPVRPQEAFLEPGVQLVASLGIILGALIVGSSAAYRLLVALGFIEG
jgi:hypothetical protein